MKGKKVSKWFRLFFGKGEGRCPKCGFTWWDCICPNSGGRHK